MCISVFYFVVSVVMHTICCIGDRRALLQNSRQEQRAPQAGPSRPLASSQLQADAARSKSRQQPAAAWPNYARSSRVDQDSSSRTSEQDQEEQQHKVFQELHGQRAQATTSASYGPAEQAEAKRQANKEAALAWLDKAKAAAANKDWTAAVSDPCKLWSHACLRPFAQERHRCSIKLPRRSAKLLGTSH